MIPKVIHYCWFGNNPLPELAVKCIESWKRYCPDYEIKEWNESNFNLTICDYVREAYEQKKWAFVSDYARFWILYHEGGVYLDTDVELLKSIDPILENGAFFGQERNEEQDRIFVNPGLGMAAERGNEIYHDVLSLYETLHFVNADGTLNKKTIVAHVTELLQEKGMEKAEIHKEWLCKVGNIAIYSWEYFCPIMYRTGDICITDNTYTIHHYTSSWMTEEEKKLIKIDVKIKSRVKGKAGEILSLILRAPLRMKLALKRYGVRNMICILIRRCKVKK